VVTLITGPVLLELHGESPAGRFSSHGVGVAVSFLLFVPEEEEEQLHEGESEEEEEEELEEEEEGEESEEEAMVAEKAEGEGEEERVVEALRFCQERVPPGMRSNSSSSVGFATPATPAARVCARFAFPCERAHCRMARLVRFSDFRCATPCRRALCLRHSCSRPSNCASVSSHSARAISACAARFARSASSSASPSSRACAASHRNTSLRAHSGISSPPCPPLPKPPLLLAPLLLSLMLMRLLLINARPPAVISPSCARHRPSAYYTSTMAAVRCRSAVSRGVCASGSLFDSQLSQRIASILGSSSDLPLSLSSSPSEPLRVTGPAAGRARFHSSSFVGADPSAAGSTPSSPAVAGDVAQSPLLPRLRSWFAAPDLTPPPFVGPTGGSEAGSGADGDARGDAQGRGEARMHGEGARGYGDQRVYGRDPRGYGRNFRPRPPVARPKLDLLDKYVHPSLLSAEERREEELQGVKERFRVHEGDTGSSEVQIALLTSRIAYMAQHLQTHKK
ncbi:unnamed protein product, partial [Closterium sp. NIES-54]